MENKFQIICYNDSARKGYDIIEEFDTREEAIEALADRALEEPCRIFNETYHETMTYEDYVFNYSWAKNISKAKYEKEILEDAWRAANKAREWYRGSKAIYDIREDIQDNSSGVYALINREDYKDVIAYFSNRADAEEFLMTLWESAPYEIYCTRMSFGRRDANEILREAIREASWWQKEYLCKNTWRIEEIEIL